MAIFVRENRRATRHGVEVGCMEYSWDAPDLREVEKSYGKPSKSGTAAAKKTGSKTKGFALCDSPEAIAMLRQKVLVSRGGVPTLSKPWH